MHFENAQLRGIPMRKMLPQRISPRVACSIGWAALGQGFDVWTTKLAIENGGREMNPLFRGLIEQKRYGTVLAIKYGFVGIGRVLGALDRPRGRRADYLATSFIGDGIVGFLAGCWNLFVLFRLRRNRKK